MQIVNSGPKDDITYFVSNVLMACEKDRLLDIIAVDVDNQCVNAWGMSFAWNENTGCKEILLYSGSNVLLRTPHARSWRSIRIPIEITSVEDLDAAASFAAADIDEKVKRSIT